MAKDGFRSVRLRESTYEELQALKRRIEVLGIGNLPPALKMPVDSLSDVVDLGLRAARKAIG